MLKKKKKGKIRHTGKACAVAPLATADLSAYTQHNTGSLRLLSEKSFSNGNMCLSLLVKEVPNKVFLSQDIFELFKLETLRKGSSFSLGLISFF